MSGSVNMPGVLALGDPASTAPVRIGRGGALVADNARSGGPGSVAIVGPLSAASLDVGT
jgi:hypothetical protein